MEIINNILFTDDCIIDLSKIIAIKRYMIDKLKFIVDKENEVIVDLSFSELTELLKQREINLQNSLKQRELTDIKNKLKL
jgi:hypothetical protein